MIIKRKYKICKRLGDTIFNKCQTQGFSKSLVVKKGSIKKRPPRARSEYGNQLIEKQKARYTYLIKERQFSNYVRKAEDTREVNSAEYLYKLLEKRLDNVIYRAGFAPSRAAARQLVSHGHITTEGTRVTIPSYQLSVGDKITIREVSKGKTVFRGLADKLKNHKIPKWLSLTPATLEIEILGEPTTGDGDSTLNLNSVMEFYSRT